MLGWLRDRLERRSTAVDVGAIYAAFFFAGGSYGWQVSPAVLAGSIGFTDGSGALLEHSRRLAKQSPLLRSYRRCMTGGVLTGAPEAPTFGEGITEDTARMVADLWQAVHPVDLERNILHRLIIDGDVLLMGGGEVIPADGFEAVTTGPDWNKRVSGWKIGKGSQTRRAGLHYIGDPEAGATRAQPWHAGALPFAAALMNIRTAAGHGLGVLARLATMMKADSTRQVAALPGVRSGLDDAEEGGERQRIETVGVGSIPYLRPGESTERPAAGPDSTAQAYESILEVEVSTALNLPLSELKSDYSSGSYSNLRMAWQDAVREYERRRLWFHRHVRMPFYLEALSGWIADGRVRVGMDEAAALKQPMWPGPHREPPQPEKEITALAALLRAGLSPDEAKSILEGDPT